MEGSSHSDKRTQTLEALETFIQTQRTLLARQKSDLERLRQLRIDIIQKPYQVLSNLSNELDDPAFKLTEQADCRLSLPKDVDWTLFDNYDTSKLCTHALKARAALVQRNQPFPTQQSPLSELQLFVKQARKTLVDPILARFEQLSSPEPSSSEEEADPEEVRRQQERKKIRHLKNEKIYGSRLSFPASSTLSLKPQGTAGVFIRCDVDDETMDVDIDLENGFEGGEDGDLPSNAKTRSSFTPITDTKAGVRLRRPTVKKAQLNDTENTKERTTHRAPKKIKSSSMTVLSGQPPCPQFSPEELPDNSPEVLKSKRKSKRKLKGPKPKPETYKQSWSASEQNLLEQLLEEIPDGEKYRWLKISRAMGGMRTPRQVASRVQKYFEKLKRFGIGVT